MQPHRKTVAQFKDEVAAEIASNTAVVALADSRFGRDFSKFIPSFEGAEEAAKRLLASVEWAATRCAFVTPDNALAPARRMLLEQGVDLIVPSYGLHRGFLRVEAARVPRAAVAYAGWLDGVEYFGRSLDLMELQACGSIDLIVTGASAVTTEGLRFGMGDFYLDIEWAVLRTLGVVGVRTPVAAIVHDVQLSEADLPIDAGNLTVDLIVTPTRALRPQGHARPMALDWSIVPAELRQTPTMKAFERLDHPTSANISPNDGGAKSMDHKANVRGEVFAALRTVALPDSRFHFDFGEFIADFEGSDRAVGRLVNHRFYRDAKIIFITPDNCLEQLRYRALLDGKTVLTTSYSIKRGFWLLQRQDIAAEKLLYASTLDGMERVARPMSLRQITEQLGEVDYLVTGTGAINEEGVRFGKGHGFFDAEWGMLHRIGAIATATPAAAVVHDCQLLRQQLHPEIFDTVVDAIFTPTRTIEVADPHKPDCGIVWDLLDPKMLETIPPLQELQAFEMRAAHS